MTHLLERLLWKVRGLGCLAAGHTWKPVFAGEHSYLFCDRCDAERRGDA